MSDKVDIAVRRLQEAAEMSQMLYEKPLVITYSGGKDSDTVLKLAQIAKIPFEVLHSHTTVDAPETVYRHQMRHRLSCSPGRDKDDDVEPNSEKADATYEISKILLRCTQGGGRREPVYRYWSKVG